jgi:hypothetical protein
MTPTLAKLLTDLGDSPAAMYPKVIIAALIATVAVLLLHLLISLARGHRPARPRWHILAKLIYLGAIISVLILGVTSFYSVLAHGAMHGWFLFAHTIGAGAFVVFLLLIAVMWAMPSRFCAGSCAKAANDETVAPAAARFHGLTKLAFWLMLVSGVATAGTMLISMLPLLGTPAMTQMITVHRYAGLVLVVATIVHLYTVALARLRRL